MQARRRSRVVRIVRTRRGVRLVEGGDVLSEILARPGPTHSTFDVLAASVAVLAPDSPLVMLGFAGGGVLAPLRAMGHRQTVEAVDLTRAGVSHFRRLCREWAGEVSVAQADAVIWLAGHRGRCGAILEDLSVIGRAGVTKPDVSFETLPRLMAHRLAHGGVAIFNVVSVHGIPWTSLLDKICAPFGAALVVTFEAYENRVVIASSRLDSAARLSRRLRAALAGIGSRQATRIRVRTLRAR
jgi:hypothetical protein